MQKPTNEIAIVLSKLDIPSEPIGSIKRVHFLRELALSCSKKLTCVVAGRGCGKHTALAQLTHIIDNEEKISALVENNTIPLMRVSWLYVDERDNDPAHFWTHVLALIPDAPKYHAATDYYELLFPLVNRRFDDQHLVVFNRIDRINNPDVLNVLMRLIFDSPQGLHFVFSMRAMPDCIRGKAYNLNSRWFTRKDFQYSRVETEAQLRMDLGDLFEKLTANNIDAIYALTEGWARGIDLAAQTARTAFLSGNPFVFGGLSPEVDLFFSSWASMQIAPKVLDILKVLSLTERFNKQLIDFVFADEVDDGFSAALLENDAFLLVPWGKDPSWFRINGLFCDWLRKEVVKLPKMQTSSSCMKIGAWFFSRGDTNEATKYLLMAEDFEYLEGMAYSLTTLKRRERTNPLIWLAGMNSSQIDESPLLCILAAWAHNAAGHVSEAQFWTEQFVQVCKSGENQYSSVPVDFARRFMTIKCQVMAGGGEDVFEECEEIIDSSDNLGLSLLSTLYQTMGESKIQSGQLADAEDLFLQAQACASVDGTTHQLFFGMYIISEMNYRFGNLDEVEKTCRNLLSDKNASPVFRSAAQALLGLVYTERMDFSIAESLISEARQESSIFQNLDLYLIVEISQANYLLATGRAGEAYILLAEAVMRAERFVVPRDIILDAYFYQSLIAAVRHNTRDLKVILKKFETRLCEGDAIHEIEYLYMKALLEKAEGNLAQSINCLDDALNYASENGFRLHRARILVTKVSCQYQMSDIESAKETLYQAIQEASIFGYPNSLMGHEKSVENALINYSSSSQASPAIREFIKEALSKTGSGKISASFARNSAPGSGLASLSEREREVISLLQLGMSRQEISDALCVSINTTKKHLASVYSKLGVSSRAELLGLLPQNF